MKVYKEYNQAQIFKNFYPKVFDLEIKKNNLIEDIKKL